MTISGGNLAILNGNSNMPISASDARAVVGGPGTINFDGNYMYYNLGGTWLRFAVTPW